MRHAPVGAHSVWFICSKPRTRFSWRAKLQGQAIPAPGHSRGRSTRNTSPALLRTPHSASFRTDGKPCGSSVLPTHRCGACGHSLWLVRNLCIHLYTLVYNCLYSSRPPNCFTLHTGAVYIIEFRPLGSSARNASVSENSHPRGDLPTWHAYSPTELGVPAPRKRIFQAT